MSSPSHYKVLQVDPEAEFEVIQAAYRRLARKYHPDLAADPRSADRMTAINAAWAVLRDPSARVRYDAELRSAPGSRFPDDASPTATEAGPATETAPPADPATGPRATWGGTRQTSAGPGSTGAMPGYGEAGPPPGNPAGSVITFGRYVGWSLGEIARRDLEFLEWLERMPIGRPYKGEIDRLLRAAGRRAAAEAPGARGLPRRR